MVGLVLIEDAMPGSLLFLYTNTVGERTQEHR